MIGTNNLGNTELFQNQPLERLAGIYFESIANLHIYRDNWRFINYVNLAPLEEKEKILNFFTHKIDLLCFSKYGDDITCSGLQELERLKRKLINVKINRQTINDLVGRLDEKSDRYRSKRGVFDFVGQISKILFGTLDSSDADYYNEQIDLVYNNSNN